MSVYTTPCGLRKEPIVVGNIASKPTVLGPPSGLLATPP